MAPADVGRKLTWLVAALVVAGCGRELPFPRILVPDVQIRTPEKQLFDSVVPTDTRVRSCNIWMNFSHSLGVLHDVELDPIGLPGSWRLSTPWSRWHRWWLGSEDVEVRDRNPFRQSHEQWLRDRLVLAPGRRVEFETYPSQVPSPEPPSLVHLDPPCAFQVLHDESGYEPSYVELPTAFVREDGSLTLRGVVRDARGRPTDIWVVDGERDLYEILVDWNADYLHYRGLTTDGRGGGGPLRVLQPALRAPRHSANIQIRWYPDRDWPAEIWGEADGIAEGQYVAIDPRGQPLVMGEHVMGVRHGLWYYFGHEQGRLTLQAMQDYELGEVIARWERAPGTDPLRDPASAGPR